MVAMQLAYEPLIRKCIREMYMERNVYGEQKYL